MKRVNLSKSRYCSAVQCEKILWLNQNKPELSPVEDKTVFEKGRQVGELAKGLFGDYEDVTTDADFSTRLNETERLLQSKSNIITEASFSFNGNFCSVDILKNDSDGVEIYEVKSSTKIKDIYLDDISYQYFVLKGLGFNVKKACIVYINNEYIRGNDLDIEQLFTIDDVTDEVLQKQDEIKNNIDFIKMFMQAQDEPEKEIGKQCFDPYSCEFWDYCTKDLPKPNVFDISGMKKSTKFKKYFEGKISFEDLQNEDINPKYLEQIDFELNDCEAKINADVIREIIDSLKYPLYFIDYETCQYAIPEYEGTKPYQQIPFQYSLHIIEEPDAPLTHKEYLADVNDGDLIRTFAESMIREMPQNGA